MQIKYIVDETGINFEHPPNRVMGFNPVILDAMSEKMVEDSYKSNLRNVRSFLGNYSKLRTINLDQNFHINIWTTRNMDASCIHTLQQI